MPEPSKAGGLGPQFSNPFERQRSLERVPTGASATHAEPLLTTISESQTSSSPPQAQSGTWRNRAASVFQSFSSDASTKSAGSQQSSPTQAQRDRLPSMAPRRPSYVPKYAARAHLSNMTGRTTSVSGFEIDEQLRRGSRMMSVVSANSAHSPTLSSPAKERGVEVS